MKATKPARVQVEPTELEDEQPPQTGTVFNIWYSKWSGGGSEHAVVRASHRLNVEKDSGTTRADKNSTQHFFCIFFAKGMCCKGRKCEYLHRVPADEDVFPVTVDCFGRERFSTYRDDMSGVGSFNTVNRTLYVGGVLNRPDIQDTLSAQFRSLGKLDRVNVIAGKSCAFVTYKTETCAQFAKEVMHGQSLYGTDTLTVKWAHEDPNPQAEQTKKRELEEQTMETVKGLLERYEKRAKTTQIEAREPEVVDTKAIEAPPELAKNSSILSNTNLSALRLLKSKAPKPLVSYASSDED